MGKKLKIAYLCDGLDACSDMSGCFRCMKPSSNCCHTFNSRHAVNGKCDYPEREPERFTKLDGSDLSGIDFWEGAAPVEYEKHFS